MTTQPTTYVADYWYPREDGVEEERHIITTESPDELAGALEALTEHECDHTRILIFAAAADDIALDEPIDTVYAPQWLDARKRAALAQAMPREKLIEYIEAFENTLWEQRKRWTAEEERIIEDVDVLLSGLDDNLRAYADVPEYRDA